jgi:hypothetical protein
MRRSPVFQTDSIATLTEKHRGYRGLHLQTPVVKKRVPGSQGSYLRTRRWEHFLLALISCRDTMNRLGNLSCADFHLTEGMNGNTAPGALRSSSCLCGSSRAPAIHKTHEAKERSSIKTVKPGKQHEIVCGRALQRNI